ncbi:M48 family metallopeptidase [Solimicrobium silvestre]|uniref:Peptidase family M48 n=1 Tax=Solimicrobium silvestre TaxID=2099400 RepID=A0A2S9GYB5_9BURK|nr:M48 family metallopeptidase [Solimicrobium silvestre]PRC92717.1 Peptidase family M48 [Solimicrobium silvestre]
MNTLYRLSKYISAAALLSIFYSSASAQFNLQIPGLGNIGKLLDTTTKTFKEVDEPEEIRIGQEFASILLGAKPLEPDQRKQRYVNALGRWLALQTERPDLPWTFAVLDDPSFNAFATPGGYIFVTRGLLERMHNEAELAGVLSHEIGHVLRKHHLHAVQKNSAFSAAGDYFTSSTGGNAQVKSAVSGAIRNMLVKGLDKDDEYEADRIGVVIAARAGYDAYGLPSVLQTLQKQSSQDNNFTLLFKTHPLPADRLTQLDQLMGQQFDTLPGISGKTIEERLKEFGR